MIDFELSDEQRRLQEQAREFARTEISPVAAHHDRTAEFPWQVVQRAHAAGLMNLVVPREYGGRGLGVLDHCLVREELAAGCSGIAAALTINTLASMPLLLAGTEEQKRRYLAPLVHEPRIAAYCLTEDVAGSDVLGIQSCARRVGNEYVLKGTKRFVTGGIAASWFVVFAYTDREKGRDGISAFVVPRETPGVSIPRREDLMGQRAAGHAEVVFHDVPVPVDHRLGEEGQGFRLAVAALDRTRPPVAAVAVGVARTALEHAMDYARKRHAFGQPIGQHQAIQFKLAQMAMEVSAARLLAWHAAWLADRGRRNVKEASYAKAFAADVCMRATTEAVQVFGGYGCSRDFPVEKLMRDAKLVQVYEGTGEIQRLTIARELLRESGPAHS